MQFVVLLGICNFKLTQLCKVGTNHIIFRDTLIFKFSTQDFLFNQAGGTELDNFKPF